MLQCRRIRQTQCMIPRCLISRVWELGIQRRLRRTLSISGAAEDHALHKEELAGGESPFSAGMSEPAEEPETSQAVAEIAFSRDAVPLKSTDDEFAQAPEFNEPAPAVAAQTPIPEPAVIPFPKEEASSTSSVEQVPASTSGRGKAAEKTTFQFFSNNSGSAPENTAAAKNAAAAVSTPKTATPPTRAADSAAPAASTSRMTAMAKPSVSAVVPAVADEKSVKSVQRTSASSADEPLMFVPEPVPELSSPPSSDSDNFDTTPPFEDDTVPLPSRPRVEPSRPVTNSPSNEESEVPFFGEDSGTRPPTAPSSVGNVEEEPETLPFMPDDSELNELPTRPEPRVTDPPEDEFPEPQFPNRRDSGGDLDDRSRPDSFEPDSDLSNPEEGRPLPLPSSDDLPGRPDRTNFPESSDGRRPGPVPAGTVSEVMRPQLTIQKQAPETATVGVSHDYTIVVSNEGASSAYDVIVEDELGGAAEFVEARPVAEFNRAAGRLNWTFRELRAGEKKEITVRIKPTGEGTLDGVATVRFKAQVKSATVITAPKLELQLTGPDQVKVGDEVQLAYTIRNRGSGDAANVVLRSVLPPGLKHPEGGDLEYEIENLCRR